jgi:hypothetical protein
VAFAQGDLVPARAVTARRNSLVRPRLRAKGGDPLARGADPGLELGVCVPPEVHETSVIVERLLPVAFLVIEAPECLIGFRHLCRKKRQAIRELERLVQVSPVIHDCGIVHADELEYSG